MNAISIPIIVLNVISGIVSGIWLIILGQWKIVVAAILISLFVLFVYLIVAMIQMPLVLLMSYAVERSKKTLAMFSGFLNLFIGYAIILFYVFMVLVKVIEISIKTNLNIIPLLLLGYSVATGPFSYLASKEREDSFGSFIAVFIAQISYLLFAITVLLNISPIALPIILLIVFGTEIYQLNLLSQMLNDSIESRELDNYYEN